MRRKNWTDEKERLLLQLIERGANNYTIQNRIGFSTLTINKKLKEMGFKHITDAKEKLKGES